MAWDPTHPASGSGIVSGPLRDNFAHLDTMLVAALGGLANGQVLTKSAGPIITGVAPSTDGFLLTLVSGAPAWQAPAPSFGNPMTAAGDLIVGTTAGAPGRLGAGLDGQYLTLSGGIPAWVPLPVDPGFANPLTTAGDILIGGASGTPTRLAAVAVGQVLSSAGVGVAPVWKTTPVTDHAVLQGAPNAILYFRPPGGHEFQWFAGGTGSSYPNEIHLFNATQGRTLFRYYNNEPYLQMWDGTGFTLRKLLLGTVDSAGAGYRVIMTPNS